MNECDSSPCANNGVCADQANGYVCHCTDGWTGYMCDVSIDDCVGVVCDSVDYTTCVDTHLGHTCQCQDGFVGEL